MSDNPAKRVPRTFEPPPWERDAFEELARKREAEEAAAREAGELAAQLRAAEALKAQAAAKKGDEAPVVAAARALAEAELAKEQGGAAATVVEDAKAGEPADAAPVVATPEGAASRVEQGATAESGAPKIDDRKVAEMLAVLSTQEPKAKGGGVLALVVGIAFVVLGVAMIVISVRWQAVGQQQSGTTASTLLFQVLLVGGFGLGFAIVGGLIVYLGRQQARS
jgi:hypothetical protein